MKRKSKIIIPALGMLLLSTAASITGTVAWFAANNIVNVNAMTVTANSDTAYLLIGNEDANTVSLVQSGKATTVTAKNATSSLLPAAHETLATNVGYSTIEATSGSPVKYSNWYYGYSADPAASDLNTETKSYVASDKFDKYVLLNKFYVCTAVGSNQMTDLRVNNLTVTTAGDSAVKTIVASSTANEEFAASATGDRTNPVHLASTVTDSALVELRVYIYWDGNDTDVYTNGIADLKDTSVSFSLIADIAAA